VLTKVQAVALAQSGVTGLIAMGLLLGYSCSGNWELNPPEVIPDSVIVTDTLVVPDTLIIDDDEDEPDEIAAPTGGSITPLA